MSRYKVTAPYPLDLPDGTVGAPGDLVTVDQPGDLADRGLLTAVPEPEKTPDEPAGDEPEPEQPTTRHRKAKTTEESA